MVYSNPFKDRQTSCQIRHNPLATRHIKNPVEESSFPDTPNPGLRKKLTGEGRCGSFAQFDWIESDHDVGNQSGDNDEVRMLNEESIVILELGTKCRPQQ